MKKRRTRKQKIGAKRKMVGLTHTPIITSSSRGKTSRFKSGSVVVTNEAINSDSRQALKAIQFDLLKVVVLSLLIFGLEISIYFWWN